MSDVSPGTTGSRLDHFLATWHVREVHRIAIAADPRLVMRAVRETTWSEAPLGRALMLLTRNDVAPGRRIIEDIEGANLLEDSGDELVFGVIGSRHGQPDLAGPMADEFRGFTEPGYLKIGINFRYAGGVLSTETRVLCTDPAELDRFRFYWMVIRAGSGLIRGSTLRAVRRRALSTMDPPAHTSPD